MGVAQSQQYNEEQKPAVTLHAYIYHHITTCRYIKTEANAQDELRYKSGMVYWI